MSFDNFANTWDTDKRTKRAKIISEEIEKAIFTSGDKKYSAMEFGCGTGLVSFFLYSKFENITLIDSSKGMIDKLKSKITSSSIKNMYPLYLDITKEKSLEKTFDVIYTSMAMHHVHNVEETITIFHKYLNKDGYLCIVDLDEEDGSFHKDYKDFDGYNGFKQDFLKNMLNKAGFKDIHSNTFYYDIKIIQGEKVNYSLFIIVARK